MSDNNYTVFNAMVDIVASPGKALDAAKANPRWFWWPLLVSIVVSTAAFVYYFTWVDYEWLIEETIRSVPAADRAAAEPAIRSFMSPGTSILSTVAVIVIITFAIYAIQAVYLHLANKLSTGAEVSYGQWFGFSAWTAFVMVLGSVAAFVVMFLADSNQLAQHDLTPLSLNALLIHAKPGDPWFAWGNSLTLFNIWTLVLMTIGYHRWTGAGMVKSAIIACLPWVLIFGTWAALI
ncbi:YIP1 family protein [Marinihelvus fidelis]|uniref:YIP1 family protein n=1 Tax=Marinihelvus fidelis TaxID=2613842 RepID=A0A5N0TF51_9GAMM|nr:Yip1 family protein [Marinihelvus fidelis]KAA9132506.1 YIP1 family protein [Marinihelvus fidelis]